MTRRLEAAGFAVEALLGDYQGGPWDPRADVWIFLATSEEPSGMEVWWVDPGSE